MRFAGLLENAIASAIPSNVVTDGNISCLYREIPALLDGISAFLAPHSLNRGVCVTLECPNTLPGALTLFALLRLGISVHLQPPPPAPDAALRPLPHFSKHRVRVERLPPGDSSDLLYQPQTYLRLDPIPVENSLKVVHPLDSGLLFIRTSGSMGASKLVVHHQDLLMENALSCARKYRFSAQDRAAIPVPIAHLYGLGAELLPALFSGASIDLQDQTHLLKYLDRERLFEPNIAFMTPGLCELLLKGFKRPRTRYRLVVTSGQRIGDALFDAFDARIGGCLVNQYGSSELGATAACDPDDALDLKRQTIGRPFPGVLLSIEPPDTGLKHTPLPGTEGNTGELYCQHPFGFLGYVDDSGRWLLRRNPASWHPTGDLAHQDVQGHFQILDRAGNSINRRGYLVSFAELERQFESIWNKERVIVVRSEHHTPGSERIAAFCVSESRSGNSSSPPGEVLRDLCVQRLPPWAVPDDVYVIDAFPILSSGKVDIQRLVSMAVSAQVSREISGDHLRAGSLASTISTAANLQGVESS